MKFFWKKPIRAKHVQQLHFNPTRISKHYFTIFYFIFALVCRWHVRVCKHTHTTFLFAPVVRLGVGERAYIRSAWKNFRGKLLKILASWLVILLPPPFFFIISPFSVPRKSIVALYKTVTRFIAFAWLNSTLSWAQELGTRSFRVFKHWKNLLCVFFSFI